MKLLLLPIKSLLNKLEENLLKDRERTDKQIKSLKIETTALKRGIVTFTNNVWNGIANKMNTSNPTGSGSFSLNRKSGTTKGVNSVACGYEVTASGSTSHAEGFHTTASGSTSHAEGYHTTASGSTSHAEGSYTTASGSESHTEGRSTRAHGQCSHAEGIGSDAYGLAAHAEGDSTWADGDGAHAQGRYNRTDDAGKYAHIVGNGENLKRSNAHTLDWNGVGWFQGGLQVGGNAQDDGAKNVLLDGDAVPAPETATVGQTMVVKAVDDDGKPTAWEPVDMPSGGGSEWELIGEAVSDGEGDVTGVTIPIDFQSYRALFVRAYDLPAGATMRIVGRQNLVWYNGLPFGLALTGSNVSEGGSMLKTWELVGIGINLAGQMYTSGAAEAVANSGHSCWRSGYKTGTSVDLPWEQFRYVSLDTNNNGVTPAGCTLQVWGVK